MAELLGQVAARRMPENQLSRWAHHWFDRLSADTTGLEEGQEPRTQWTHHSQPIVVGLRCRMTLFHSFGGPSLFHAFQSLGHLRL